jgi:hypothetical protein
MAKKIGLLMMLISFFLFPISVGATPDLGVIGTDLLATDGGTTPVGMDGFQFPSDGRITVWWGTNSGKWEEDDPMLDVHVWLLTTQGETNTFTVDTDLDPATTPVTYFLNVPVTVVPATSENIDGYPKPYFGADLGSIKDGSWLAATEDTAPDLTNGKKKSFYLLNGVFGGGLSTDNWIFAVADINPTGTVPIPGVSEASPVGLVFNNGDDDFSPKTTSTTSNGVVPEPSTLLLLGSGLTVIALWGRKKFKAKS